MLYDILTNNITDSVKYKKYDDYTTSKFYIMIILQKYFNKFYDYCKNN